MITPSQLSWWLLEYEDIWQLDLHNPRILFTFMNDRKVNFQEEYIFHLWQLGWVRAEIVQASADLAIDGFSILKKVEGEHILYEDNRELGLVHIRAEEPVRELDQKLSGVVPYFHPFKYYVFWHIQQVLRLMVHPYQMMLYPNGYHKLLDFCIESFYGWAQSEAEKVQIQRWDEITRLAIASEPCFYPQIIGSLKYPIQITEEEQRSNIEKYKTQLKDQYLQIGIESIKAMIKDLCIAAEIVEPNKNIHSLIRFMNGNQRIKVTGNLGGAILLKLMAEVIRRMAELSFGIQLPEEDEMGFGMWVNGARERIYGSKRIFDSYGLLSKRQFVRQLGLDSEIRIRIYVEGLTEFSAFKYLIKPWQQIEVIDLCGQFVQGKKKGLAFRENLINDDHNGVFSLIILDADREDNIRVVRKAAEEDLFCGQFYLSAPDFEFTNFSIDELILIAWRQVDEVQKSQQLFQSLCAEAKETTNADTFIKAVNAVVPSLSQLTKGNEWGEKLAEFAASTPEFPGSGSTRPFIDAFQTAFRSIDIDFLQNRRSLRVNPETGKLVHR